MAQNVEYPVFVAFAEAVTKGLRSAGQGRPLSISVRSARTGLQAQPLPVAAHVNATGVDGSLSPEIRVR
jgi:hypothetical protein